jgi:hypothetical protein
VNAYTFEWRRMTEAERTAAAVAWLQVFDADPPGQAWAHPCPQCGSLVTDPLAHLRRVHVEATP